jgi:hypothetical protein
MTEATETETEGKLEYMKLHLLSICVHPFVQGSQTHEPHTCSPPDAFLAAVA